ncbi:MAG: serine protease, partial [Bacteroidia bacterium]
VAVVVNRDGKEKALTVLLKNKDGEAKITEKEEISPLLALGIDLKDIDADQLNKFGVNHGVKVENVNDGLLRRNTKIRAGFIITKIDDKNMKSADDIEQYFEKKKSGKGMIEGFYPGVPGKVYYGYGLD